MSIDREFRRFIWRVAATHSVAYFLAGIFAITFLGYEELFNTGPLSFMRPTDSAWVAAGPGLQIVRGILLALILWPFRPIFFDTQNGWWKFWILSFGLSYVLTISAATGSFEGIIYTNLPLKYHLLGLPEIVLYMSLFTVVMKYWYLKPSKSKHIISVILVSIILLMSTLGVMASLNLIQTP